MTRRDIGFDHWFAGQTTGLDRDGCGYVRISAVDRGSYLIRDAVKEVPAALSGKLAQRIECPAGLPCVGDWVTAQWYNNDASAIIHQVLPRKTFLRRKTPGQAIDHQMIAANVDTAFLVQSCHFDFNPRRLERYLVMAADGHVEPVVLLTKTDLIATAALETMLAIIRSVTTATVMTLSTVTGSGFAALQQRLLPGKTYCLLGSSGVGKTTLVNRLIGQEAFATKAVSSTGEGTHTTTRRQLVVLHSGAMLIDTPGLRELGIIGAGDEVDMGFEDIAALSAQCRYADCRHGHEPGCAVRAAVERGELPEDRYASFLKLKKESAYYGMSQLEKRHKDKAFGRLVKSVKKRRWD